MNITFDRLRLLRKLRLGRLRPGRVMRVGLLSAFAALGAFVVLDTLVVPLPVEKLRRPKATFVYSQEKQLLNAYTSADYFWRMHTGLADMSPRLVESVVSIEDRYFFYHPGVNVVSLASAAVDNVRAGRIVRGGSTLTMQIARMMEPKERTVTNKLFEIFRALQLEWHYSKTELLELYFNLAPYGGNVEGVGAASYFYFNKQASELTWSEAALLAAIPNSPEEFRPDSHPNRARQRRDWLLRRLAERGVIDHEQLASALEESLPASRQQVPKTAPHFCQSLVQKYPDSCRLVSSLRYDAQLLAEHLSVDYLTELRTKDIHNLAVVVIDNATGRILAMVGSPDVNDAQHGGEVNGALAARSPGSALKPFVYALAFELGLLAPEQKVADIPVDYAGYRPVNYDEQFHGVVSVRNALVNSYNVPAVNAAAEVGLPLIHKFLRKGGLTTLDKDPYEYGLPLVLGSAEVRLVELANLYATLSRGGNFVPVIWLDARTDMRSRRILSEGVCYLTTDILTGLKRPDLPDDWESAAGRGPIAWKTGTSYGRRDAWAVGYTPCYTVGVWAGNFDGKGSVNLVGAELAAPLMFDLFNSLQSDAPSRRFVPPVDVAMRSVCAVSGMPASQFCSETRREVNIIGKSPAAKCTVHRPVLVDVHTGLRLKAACAHNVEHERRVVEIWPARIATWMVAEGLCEPLPEYHPVCLELPAGDNPVIVSPGDGSIFQLAVDLPTGYQKIALEASTATGGGKVHWFVDGELFASAATDDRIFYEPSEGRHVLVCTDEQGRSSKASFVVR